MYNIQFAPVARRALGKLSKDLQKRILKALLALKEEPRPGGVKKLKGEDDFYRIRIGDYRAVYQIQDNVLVIVVVRIAHRREVYR